jgi:chemotaxis protein histidine kinase CheA
MGGEISLESSKKKGTSFIVVLPKSWIWNRGWTQELIVTADRHRF